MLGLRQASDPQYTAVVYRVTLDRIDPSHVLFGTSYFGQAVRIGTTEAIAALRWKEELYQSRREHRTMGFIAALELFGEDAFTWTIVESRQGPLSTMSSWADARERAHIGSNGGTLRDMDPAKRIRQTFNIAPGGRGFQLAAMQVVHARAWAKFQEEVREYFALDPSHTLVIPRGYVNPRTKYKLGKTMAWVRYANTFLRGEHAALRKQWLAQQPGWFEDSRSQKFNQILGELDEYVAEHGDALVEQSYVNPVTGFRLGSRISVLRLDPTWRSHPKAPEFAKALEAYPHWTWHPLTSDAWHAKQSAACKKVAERTNPGENILHFRRTQPERYKQAQAAAAEAKRTPQSREKASKAKIDLMATWSPEKWQSFLEATAAAKRKRQADRLASLPAPQRAKAEKEAEKDHRSWLKKKADLEIVRRVMPSAKSTDISKYRNDGTLDGAHELISIVDSIVDRAVATAGV